MNSIELNKIKRNTDDYIFLEDVLREASVRFYKKFRFDFDSNFYYLCQEAREHFKQILKRDYK